jgi:hypothetical protein
MAIAKNSAAPGLPPSITLGRRADEPAALYVRFEPSWSRAKVRSAFLLLDARAGVPAGSDVDLEVWRARREFSSENFSWSRQPGFMPPFARGIGRAVTNSPVRIDVTELLRFFAAHPAQDHGFLVRATSRAETGITFATGADGGLPPRLDVYLE